MVKYDGKNAEDAGRVIDSSQGVQGHGYSQRGHPRGHASAPDKTEATESVERYSSISGWKSGFQSRIAQDEVGHAALSSMLVHTAMENLNGGSTREAITVPLSELAGINDIKMGKWVDGQRVATAKMRSILILLQHHQGQHNNPRADVHIHTFYPLWNGGDATDAKIKSAITGKRVERKKIGIRKKEPIRIRFQRKKISTRQRRIQTRKRKSGLNILERPTKSRGRERGQKKGKRPKILTHKCSKCSDIPQI